MNASPRNAAPAARRTIVLWMTVSSGVYMRAIQRGKILAAQGADIVDIGAESTLAHAARASDTAQKSKLIPVIKKLRAEKILVSVETYSPKVTRATLEAGASILNLTGTAGSKEAFKMVAAHDAAVIICFVQGKNVREVGDYDLSADPIPSAWIPKTGGRGRQGMILPAKDRGSAVSAAVAASS